MTAPHPPPHPPTSTAAPTRTAGVADGRVADAAHIHPYIHPYIHTHSHTYINTYIQELQTAERLTQHSSQTNQKRKLSTRSWTSPPIPSLSGRAPAGVAAGEHSLRARAFNPPRLPGRCCPCVYMSICICICCLSTIKALSVVH